MESRSVVIKRSKMGVWGGVGRWSWWWGGVGGSVVKADGSQVDKFGQLISRRQRKVQDQ